jgi:methyl coenzyme M reductase beta subunit
MLMRARPHYLLKLQLFNLPPHSTITHNLPSVYNITHLVAHHTRTATVAIPCVAAEIAKGVHELVSKTRARA